MHKIIRKFEDVDAQLIPLNVQDETILQQLEQEDPLLANQCHYIWKYGNYPVYDTTAVKFYPEAYLGYEEQLKELEPELKAVCAYHVIGSEDFAYISQKIPASYMCIGAGIEDVSKRYVEHNPRCVFMSLPLSKALLFMPGQP